MYSGSSGKFSCPQRQSCSLVSPCFCTAHNRFRYKTLNLGKRQIYKSSRSNTFLFVVITECSIFMAYTDPLLASKHLRPVDIFTSHWRLLSLAGACYSYFKYLPIWWIPLILFKLLWQSRGTRTFITINQKLSPKISWLLYLYAVPVDDFETNFRQAWIEQLDSSRTGDDDVLMVNIFVGKESIPVPVLFNRNDGIVIPESTSHQLLKDSRYARVPKVTLPVVKPSSRSIWAAIRLPRLSIFSIPTASIIRNVIRP
jgi:hypothetical protein